MKKNSQRNFRKKKLMEMQNIFLGKQLMNRPGAPWKDFSVELHMKF